MEAETERTYTRLLTRMVKHPAKTPIECMPLLLACPDWPVPKSNKMSVDEATVNGGRHIQGIYLVPPQTRLTVGLDQMLQEKQSQFAGQGKLLSRLHAEPITRTAEKASDYVMKSMLRQRITAVGVIILPRTHREMGR